MTWDLKDYVDVPARLKMLAEKYPQVRIIEYQPVVKEVGGKTYIEVKVCAWRDPDDKLPAVAFCWEPFPGTTPYTRDSEQMNAATSALGRLVAIMLPGVFAKQASANEVMHRAGPPKQAPKFDTPAIDPWADQPTPQQQVQAIVERHVTERKAASAGSPATIPQLKMLSARAKAKGLTVADDIRVFCADTIGRDITSSRELTKAEASKVIDAIIALPDKK